MAFILGIDVGGSHISSGLVSDGSPGIAEESLRRTEIRPDLSAPEFLDVISEHAEHNLNIASRQVEGIAFSMPGPFDYDRGVAMIHGVG